MSWNAGRQLQVLLRGRSCLVALPALPASSSSLYLTLLPTCSKSFHSSPAVSAKKYDDSYRGGRFSKGPSKLEDLVVPRLVRPPKTSVANATEWSKDLDQDSISLVLDEFMRRPMVRKMAAEIGLSDKLFMSAYQNFRSYCLDNLDSIDPALLVAFRDIIKDNHDVELLYDYFIEHSKRVFPHLEAMDDLRLISDLKHPHNWYPDARVIQRKIFFHAGPTNSGKTFSALKRFREAKTGVYCGPLKLLAAEVFTRTNELGVACDMVTGEERRYAVDNLHPSAHLSSTVEMLSTTMRVDVAVIDEIQMLRDEQRGWAWTRALLGAAADEVHLCGEFAAIDIVKKLVAPIGEHVEVIEYERKSKLTIANEGLGKYDKIENGDCIVCFSKKSIYYTTKKLDEYGIKPAVIYGDLPPSTKLGQAAKFNDPEDPCNVLVATDAIGMGLNLNIRRIIFNSLARQTELIPNYQALQIAGRAGRYGTAYADGIATTMRKEDIGTLKEILAEPIQPIKAAGLAPTFDQIETFSFHLPQASFVRLLDMFMAVCSLSDHFFICTVQEMRALAEMIEPINLPLKVRYTFCVSPLNIDHKLTATAFVRMARRFSTGSPLTYDWLESVLQMNESPPKTFEQLAELERYYEVMEEYLWLSLRFPDMLPDEEIVRLKSKEIDQLIEEGVENLLLLMTDNPMQGKLGSIAAKEKQRRQTTKEMQEWERVQQEDAESRTKTLTNGINSASKRKGLRTLATSAVENSKGTETEEPNEEAKENEKFDAKIAGKKSE